jgi:hypothetical protein
MTVCIDHFEMVCHGRLFGFFLVIRHAQGVACQERIVLRNEARPSLVGGGVEVFLAGAREGAGDESLPMKNPVAGTC